MLRLELVVGGHVPSGYTADIVQCGLEVPLRSQRCSE